MDLSDDMQRQAKAVADPSRFRLFRHILEAGGPVGVAELTELLGFNHNAIRQHLAVLVEAGLVAETTERRTVVGRPRKEYTARNDALSAFRSVSGSYQRLAELLLEMVTTGDEPYDVGLRAATSPNGSSGDDGADDAQVCDELVRELATQGFEPEPTGEATVVLGHCPFADAAAADPGVICELHRGLIDGHLRNRGDGHRGELVPKNPHRAGCVVKVLR